MPEDRDLDCAPCDRAEMPDDVRVIRTAGPFNADSLPAGLRAPHRVADGVWGSLRVLEGSVTFEMGTDPPVPVTLVAGDLQAIPPGVPHRVIVGGPMTLEVDFLTRHDDRRTGA